MASVGVPPLVAGPPAAKAGDAARSPSPGSPRGAFDATGSGTPVLVPVGRSLPASVGRIPAVSGRLVWSLVRPALSTKPVLSTVREAGGLRSGRCCVAPVVVVVLAARPGA
jgi:hypothetical protein